MRFRQLSRLCCRHKGLSQLVIVFAIIYVVIDILHHVNYTVHDRSTNTQIQSDSLQYLHQMNPNEDSTECLPSVHLAVVVLITSDCRDAALLLKTVLFHTTRPLFVHVICTGLTCHVMSTLLSTWPQVPVQFRTYVISDQLNNENKYFIVKWRLPAILTVDVDKVIYLSHKMRVVHDVTDMWTMLNDMARTNLLLGLVRNPSSNMVLSGSRTASVSPVMSELLKDLSTKQKVNYYLYDVILYNLAKMRTHWLSTTLSTLQTETQVDTLLQLYWTTVTSPGCSWSVRLNNEFDHTACTHVKAFITDATKTRFHNNPSLELAKEQVDTVISSPDTSHVTHTCVSDTPQSTNTTDQCMVYRYATSLRRSTHLFYIAQPDDVTSASECDVTLMTQLTLDRFGVLERMMTQWTGPAAVVLYVTETEALELQDKVTRSAALGKRRRIVYHVVYKRQNYYPINYLRNVAVNNSWTPYVLFVDVDLLPSVGLYESLQTSISTLMHNNNNTVLVVPAFSALTNNTDFPRNKEELIQLINEKKAEGYKMSRAWNLGHRPTNFTHWMTATTPYKIVFADAFEPYIVMHANSTPRFNERLLERMGDKIAYGRLVHGEGYQMVGLHNAFVLHIPHPVSEGAQRWASESGYMRCGSVLFEEFRSELYKRYPHRTF